MPDDRRTPAVQAGGDLAAGTTRFEELKGRSRFICNQDGWEEVADLALAFLAEA